MKSGHAVPAACPTASNRLGSCNAACGRYRRRHQNGWLGKGAGHPSAHLSVSSRGVMNRQTLDETQYTNGSREGTLRTVSVLEAPTVSASEISSAAHVNQLPAVATSRRYRLR